MPADDGNDHRSLDQRAAAAQAGRTPPLFIRMASGLNLWARVDRQAERDALVHRLTILDRQLVELSNERRPIVDALAASCGTSCTRRCRGATDANRRTSTAPRCRPPPSTRSP